VPPRVAAVLALALLPAAAGCGPPFDVKAGLQAAGVQTGWFDAGIVEGKNKLVPSISLTLKNVADRPVSRVQLNAVFYREGEDGEFDTVLTQGIDRDPLAPGASTPPLMIRATVGYTAEPPQSRAEMLQHSQFRDARVRVFAKHGSAQWAELGTFPIERTLLTR
jgi:hypothetical protein